MGVRITGCSSHFLLLVSKLQQVLAFWSFLKDKLGPITDCLVFAISVCVNR